MPFAALSPATRSPALASAAQITLRLHRAVRPGGGQAASCRMQSAPGSVSSDPLEADSLRYAWSCPLSNEIFQVEPQGPEEEVAGLGVAIALGKLLSEWSDPVRRLSNLSLCRSLRIGLTYTALLGRAGCQTCSTRGSRGSQEWERPRPRSRSLRCTVVWSSNLRRASFTSLSWCSSLACTCPWPRS